MSSNENDYSNEEIKILLKKNLDLSEENNRMIRSMRNAARFHSFIRVLILIAIVAGAVWSYHYLKPYLDQIKATYNSYQETQKSFQDTINKFR